MKRTYVQVCKYSIHIASILHTCQPSSSAANPMTRSVMAKNTHTTTVYTMQV